MTASLDFSSRPPRAAEWLLRRLHADNGDYTHLGDFAEIFAATLAEKGRARAVLGYWSHVLRSVPGFIANKIYWSLSMLRNYAVISLKSSLFRSSRGTRTRPSPRPPRSPSSSAPSSSPASSASSRTRNWATTGSTSSSSPSASRKLSPKPRPLGMSSYVILKSSPPRSPRVCRQGSEAGWETSS